MKSLNNNETVDIEEDWWFGKQDVLNLFRLQKQILVEENIILDLVECANIWQHYSGDLCASWLFFPDKDEDILSQIKSSDYFTSFEEYSK